MADIFTVVADGTRRDILGVLRDREGGEVSVSEIVATLGLSQPTVSKHLKVLRDAGLVSVREEGQHRYYSVLSDPLSEIGGFVASFSAPLPDLAGAEEGEEAERVEEHGGAHALGPGAADAAARIGEVAAELGFRARQAVERLRGLGG